MDHKRVYPPVLSDLHTHTSCSDGLLSPIEFIDYARERKMSVIAVTDHDNMNALPEINKYVQDQSIAINIIPGIEISTTWVSGLSSFQIHIVGLFCDQNAHKLQKLIAEHKEKRDYRVQVISEKLVKYGIDGESLEQYLDGFRNRGTFITRKHFGDYLVRNKIVKNSAEAFELYLSKGARAYCKIEWCSIREAIDIIKDSGGIPILAHPMRYSNLNSKTKLRNQLIQHFAESGGVGIEVAHPHMAMSEKIVARDYAIKYNLYASYGSDFHEPGILWRSMGEDLWLCPPCRAIWEHYKFKGIMEK